MEAFFTFDPPEIADRPYSVSEINSGVSAALRQAGSLVLVEGELSAVKRAGSGHIYMTLCDEQAQIPAVMWKGNSRNTSVDLKVGMTIQAVAMLRVYERGGYYQLDMQRVFEAGAGQLAAQLEALKQKLFEEGLFDSERKKRLPSVITRVGVVTAEGSAALSDILKTIRNYSDSLDIVLSPALVQGGGAPASLVEALRKIDESGAVDVVIFGRGGGSAEDLSCFNAEAVVRAVAACETPIISAVGHEIDTTLTDLAADRRAATPTAAAELVVENIRYREQRFNELITQFSYELRHILQEKRFSFERVARNRAFAGFVQSLNDKGLTVDALEERLLRLFKNRWQGANERVHTGSRSLDQLSPLKILRRGYTAVRKELGMPVLSVADLQHDEQLSLRFFDGEASVTVTDIAKKELY